MYSELRLDPWIEVALQQKNAGTVSAVPLLSSSPSLCRPLVVRKCNNLKKEMYAAPFYANKHNHFLHFLVSIIFYMLLEKKLNAGVDLMQQLRCDY